MEFDFIFMDCIVFTLGPQVLRVWPIYGSDLAPGRYDVLHDRDKIYNRLVSKRGPYDVFSEDRSKVIHGHYAIYVSGVIFANHQ